MCFFFFRVGGQGTGVPNVSERLHKNKVCVSDRGAMRQGLDACRERDACAVYRPCCGDTRVSSGCVLVHRQQMRRACCAAQEGRGGAVTPSSLTHALIARGPPSLPLESIHHPCCGDTRVSSGCVLVHWQQIQRACCAAQEGRPGAVTPSVIVIYTRAVLRQLLGLHFFFWYGNAIFSCVAHKRTDGRRMGND